MIETWNDGFCKKCGSIVIETGCNDSSDGVHFGQYDYMNRCTNEKCEENKWHYCYDDEEHERVEQ